MEVRCTTGKGVMSTGECMACSLNDPACGYDYTVIKSILADTEKASRQDEIHVTDLTGCLRHAWYGKCSPAPERLAMARRAMALPK